ncbi:hypothetical protein O9993_22785 [Vibrio lentus]|nr:hypothetical protein [Vibrio lentus]
MFGMNLVMSWGDVQQVKLAAIEAEWHTEEAPASFTPVRLPNHSPAWRRTTGLRSHT